MDINGINFVPVMRYEDLASLVGETVIIFATGRSRDNQWHTKTDEIYVGPLSTRLISQKHQKPQRRGVKRFFDETDIAGYSIVQASKYHLVGGQWESVIGNFVTGVDKDSFNIRQVHCPSVFYEDRLIL